MTEQSQEFRNQAAAIEVIDAGDWIETAPPASDPILENLIEAGDKMAVIASSKRRKSLFVLQMALSLAAGRDFLRWTIPKPRRVLYVQFEVKKPHCHRRNNRLARAMKISKSDLGGRLKIISARGLRLTGEDGLKAVMNAVKDFYPEVIIFDPLYKIQMGNENAAEDFKILLNAFDAIAEETKAAIIYVHHDAKGTPGDRDTRDRGAGSGVLGRDYDACIVLTPHANDPDATIVETLAREYPPQDDFSVVFEYDKWTDSYGFKLANGIEPKKKTSAKPGPLPLESYLPAAIEILQAEGGEMPIEDFRTDLRERTGISRDRGQAFTRWATKGKNPPLCTKWDRSRAKNDKRICLPGC